MPSSGQMVSDAAASAVDFARDAARRLWGVQVPLAFGLALVFISLRGRLSPSEAGDLWGLGWTTALACAAPLWAALYRLELGGAAGRDLGPGGVQFGLAELRLIGLALAFACAALLVWLPVVAVSAIVFVLFRAAGTVALGPLGVVQVSFLVAAAVWLAALGGFAWACARMAFAAPATIGKRRLVLREAWDLGRGRAAAVLAAWALAQAPAMLTFALLALVDSMELQDPVWGARSRWPLVDSAAGGLVLGLVVAFVQVPLTVGVLGYLYRARRDRIRIESAQQTHALEPDLSPG